MCVCVCGGEGSDMRRFDVMDNEKEKALSLILRYSLWFLVFKCRFKLFLMKGQSESSFSHTTGSHAKPTAAA